MGRVTNRNGRWTIIYDLPKRWDEQRGELVRNQKSEVANPNTKSAASKLLALRSADIISGRTGPEGDCTFIDLANRWLETEVAVRSKRATVDIYQRLLRGHVIKPLGSRRISEIRTPVVQELAAERLRAGVSITYVKQIVSVISTIMSRGVDWGFMCRPIGRVYLPTKKKPEMDFLNHDEVRRLLAAARGRWRPLLAWSVWTGMRIGEVQAAKWDHLDLESGRYDVREAINRWGEFDTPKTDASADTIRVSKWLCGVMRQWHSVGLERFRAHHRRGWKEYGLLFPARSGAPIKSDTIRIFGLQRALDGAGLRRIRFHDLRHTCAALLAHETGNLKLVQRQLRHTSIKMTGDTYGHLIPEAVTDAFDKLDAGVWGASEDDDAEIDAEVVFRVVDEDRR